MSKVSKHVVPSEAGRWSVINSGAERASRTFSTLADALRYARTAATAAPIEIYVHRKDGTVKAKYGAHAPKAAK